MAEADVLNVQIVKEGDKVQVKENWDLMVFATASRKPHYECSKDYNERNIIYS